MLGFDFFHKDWLDYSDFFNENSHAKFSCNLDLDFFYRLDFSKTSLKKYRIDAAINIYHTLGDNPALCLSGGVDSQAMLQCWVEAGLPFKAYTLVFDNYLNSQDVACARYYCRKNRIELNEIPFNVISFLTRKNFDVGLKYNSCSPHFNVHYEMFDILRDMGHTGVCAGGQAPIYNNTTGKWGESLTINALNFFNYYNVTKFPCQGSFLSFYPELSWSISVLTPFVSIIRKDYYTSEYDAGLFTNFKHTRYQSKIKSYKNVGFNIVPQSTKYTGFELVKKHFEYTYGDGWEFERRFRHPLEKMVKRHDRTTEVVIDDKTHNLICELNSDYMTTSNRPSTGISD